ncbi:MULTISPECIES: LytTR family DNA-binding domain-containing protein [unclassified Sphingomonas]|jgi:LytTr DNA-binding domain|nr:MULTISPECIES: LytTR family DNA-binding domain-containing protein [unclassified Sphingomonas]
MPLGERLSERLIAPLLLLFGLVALGIAAWPWPAAVVRPAAPPWWICPSNGVCNWGDPTRTSLDAPVTVMRRVVRIADPRQAEALAVDVTAMASAEVRWNGVPIGANGRVGPDRAHEVPGRFTASFPVPWERLRAGGNLVEVRLSAHHRWVPVGRPVHRLAVGPPQEPLRGVLRAYLPTLIALGLLLATLLLQLLARTGRVIALLNGIVLAQAVAEASKLMLTYAYPWQVTRLFAVALLAGVGALLLAWMAGALVERRARMLLLATALAVGCAWLLPAWDAKTLWALRAGASAALAAAALGRGRMRAALGGYGLALLWASLVPGFLDSGYYLLAAAFLAIAAIPKRAVPVEAPPPAAPAYVTLPHGNAQHRVASGDLLHAQAEDDYCRVHLADGRSLLVTANLGSLVRMAAPHMIRVHRSHAINGAKLAVVHRGGPIELVDGTSIPVGRTYRAALAAWSAR